MREQGVVAVRRDGRLTNINAFVFTLNPSVLPKQFKSASSVPLLILIYPTHFDVTSVSYLDIMKTDAKKKRDVPIVVSPTMVLIKQAIKEQRNKLIALDTIP